MAENRLITQVCIVVRDVRKVSADIRTTLPVTLQSRLDLPCVLDRESTVRDWVNYRRGWPMFNPIMQQPQASMGVMFDTGDNGDGGIGMETTGFMLEMPLLSLLDFQEGSLPRSAVGLVDDLLKQAHAL